MTDNYNTLPNEDRQSLATIKEEEEQRSSKKSSSKSTTTELYKKGLQILKSKGFRVNLVDNQFLGYHELLKPNKPKKIKGINYPSWFQPLQPIRDLEDLEEIERAFLTHDDSDVRDFWKPFYHPSSGEGDFGSFCKRLLVIRERQKEFEGDEILDYNQSFDPSGTLTGKVNAPNPKIWVPAEEWFSPQLKRVKFKDVFTIFPPAERELIQLILGRIGIGRSGHRPSNWNETITHTSRMAGVVIGKDAGLIS